MYNYFCLSASVAAMAPAIKLGGWGGTKKKQVLKFTLDSTHPTEDRIVRRLAGSVGRASDSWSQSCEYKQHAGCTVYIHAYTHTYREDGTKDATNFEEFFRERIKVNSKAGILSGGDVYWKEQEQDYCNFSGAFFQKVFQISHQEISEKAQSTWLAVHSC